MNLAANLARLGTETAFDVLVKAQRLEAQGRHVIHLELGEPDFDTPDHIREAAKRALDEGFTHYGPSAGLPLLRETIAKELTRTRGVAIRPDQVVVTPGAKPIIFFALLACVNPGDEVIYPNPGFPIYESVINWIGARAVPLPIREVNDFGVDVDELAALITPRTTFLILNSPANPTGGVITHDQLALIAELVNRHHLMVLSDEIYSRIIYEGEHHSLLSFPGMQEHTILLDGFSKTYAMTGWRLGYGVMPQELAFWVARLMTNSNSCTNTFVQLAGVDALNGSQDGPRAMTDAFRRRRDAIVQGLNAIEGITCRRPAGAFYVFPNVTDLPRSSKELEDYFLEDWGVATLSGTSFGLHGEGYLRLSYANSIDNISEGLQRMAEGIGKL
ncbi:MAG: pyridoxal phosphate-dependent aminotransferase [Candidatus Marinimicrobia bacterium]|nr:pyridoxal phosphate-dependent aminotransferase [Candidatus Neomarinimicrobiota bacterium]